MIIRYDSEEDFNKKVTPGTKALLLGEDVRIKFKLRDLMEERDTSQSELSKITGLAQPVIAGFCRDTPNTDSIPWRTIMAIVIALRLTDISQLISIEMSADTQIRFRGEGSYWIDKGVTPKYRISSPDTEKEQ